MQGFARVACYVFVIERKVLLCALPRWAYRLAERFSRVLVGTGRLHLRCARLLEAYDSGRLRWTH